MEYVREEPLNKSKEMDLVGLEMKKLCKREVLLLKVSNSETCMCVHMNHLHFLCYLSGWPDLHIYIHIFICNVCMYMYICVLHVFCASWEDIWWDIWYRAAEASALLGC